MQIPQVNPLSLFQDVDPRSSWLIAGMSQCGKSTVGRFVQALYPRVVTIDSLKEYDEPAIMDLNSFKAFVKKNRNTMFGRCIYRFPRGISEKERINTFNYISEYVMLLGNVHFAVEEVHKYCTPHNIPTAYSEIWTEGRHRLVSKSASSQRLGKIHPDITSQSERKFIGQLDEENDINKACSLFLNCEEEILKLQRYNFLHKHKNIITSINTDKLRLKNS